MKRNRADPAYMANCRGVTLSTISGKTFHFLLKSHGARELPEFLKNFFSDQDNTFLGVNLGDMLKNFDKNKMLLASAYHRGQFVEVADYYVRLTRRMDQMSDFKPAAGQPTSTVQCLEVLRQILLSPMRRFAEAIMKINGQDSAARWKDKGSEYLFQKVKKYYYKSALPF